MKVSNQLFESATHYERLAVDYQRQQHLFRIILKFDITLESLVGSNGTISEITPELSLYFASINFVLG